MRSTNLSGYRYRDSDMEVYLNGSKAVVHDLTKNKYFQVDEWDIPNAVRIKFVQSASRVSMLQAYIFTGAILCLLLGNLFASSVYSSTVSFSFLYLFVPYIVVSVILHESAHLLCLKTFGRKHDKVGFKLHYFIFPAFYVRMNQSLLLSRAEKIVIHGAGVATNLIINSILLGLNLILFKSNALAITLNLTALALAYNMLPILNSDGYRMLLAFANINEFKHLKNNPTWIRIIKIMSWIFAFSYAWLIATEYMVELFK